MIRPLARVSKLRVIELSGKKTSDFSRQVLAIGGGFYLRSKFDPVLGDQKSNFLQIGNFLT